MAHEFLPSLADITIRAATLGDYPAIVGIENENPMAAQWKIEDYERLGADMRGVILVAALHASNRVVGFAAIETVLDEAELKNLAVTPAFQRRGIGRALLHEAFTRLKRASTSRIFLEVRPSNTAAVRLYTSMGFVVSYRRKAYYADPSEDAYVMSFDP